MLIAAISQANHDIPFWHLSIFTTRILIPGNLVSRG
nr:MAG TPA: hypothetical protein [Caudoviricetes sp.]DAH34945.1 MAG TPA: hypothetical protein [Bacteriophage sp.]DAM48340.1 MAG TPA: hypothetical protein [Caudoviricetes sp.]DAW40667.1 MAG TPA: hypothetical protein [Caudoviricetes sp.]DAZ59160.1 MAG TPA: hypothetical protein [Caudoviricetes sp.]